MGRKKKEQRVVVKTVRLTPEAHDMILTVAGLLELTISDALISAIKTAYPNLEDVKADDEKRKAEAARRLGEKN